MFQRGEEIQINKVIFEHIDRLAKEKGVKRGLMRFTPVAKSFIKPKTRSYNYLMKYGFYKTSLNTQIIDLTRTGKGTVE